MKDPKDMTKDELIELADRMKRGMTKKFLRDLDELERARSRPR